MMDFQTRGLVVKDEVFVISKTWWDVWTAYVHYESPESTNLLEEPSRRAKRLMTAKTGDRPVNIDNTDLQGEKLELRRGL